MFKKLKEFGKQIFGGIVVIALVVVVTISQRGGDKHKRNVPNGQKCSNDAMCASDHCSGAGRILDGVCGFGDLGNGSTCNDDSDCTSKKCTSKKICVEHY